MKLRIVTPVIVLFTVLFSPFAEASALQDLIEIREGFKNLKGKKSIGLIYRERNLLIKEARAIDAVISSQDE